TGGRDAGGAGGGRDGYAVRRLASRRADGNQRGSELERDGLWHDLRRAQHRQQQRHQRVERDQRTERHQRHQRHQHGRTQLRSERGRGRDDGPRRDPTATPGTSLPGAPSSTPSTSAPSTTLPGPNVGAPNPPSSTSVPSYGGGTTH